jgi:hypothetical protein
MSLMCWVGEIQSERCIANPRAFGVQPSPINAANAAQQQQGKQSSHPCLDPDRRREFRDSTEFSSATANTQGRLTRPLRRNSDPLPPAIDPKSTRCRSLDS